MKKVFIGGCDRSGTTFLAGLIADYEGVFMGPESQFKRDLSELEIKSLGLAGVLDFQLSNWRFREWFKDVEVLKNNKLLKENFESYEQFYEALVTIFCDEKFGVKPKVWVDHTPENFEFYDVYVKYFTDVKYVHIYRDGRAIASSLMQLEWGPNTAEAAAKFWLEKLSFPFSVQALHPDQVLLVSYEALVKNTEKELKRIFNFVDVPFVKATRPLRYLPDSTNGQHALVGAKPDEARLSAWVKVLTEKDISIFEKYAGGMLKNLGYELIGTMQPSKYTIAMERCYEILKSVLNSSKYRKKRGI